MTVTVNIPDGKDLSILREILNRLGLEYTVNVYDFIEDEIESLLKTKQDFMNGKTTAKSWNDIEEDLNCAYN